MPKQIQTVAEALQEALDWTNADIKGFEDISPNLDMLKARRKVLRAALKKAKEPDWLPLAEKVATFSIRHDTSDVLDAAREARALIGKAKQEG